jgi:1-phosphatidylinositol-4-phosphate 5-kinase
MNSLSEFMSSGKSGSFFYYSMDGKYTLKTIKFDEKLLLKKILKDYY